MDNQKKTCLFFVCLRSCSVWPVSAGVEDGIRRQCSKRADLTVQTLMQMTEGQTIIISSEGEDQEHEDEPLLPSESAEECAES